MKASALVLASLVALALGEPAGTRNLKLHEVLEGTPGGFSRVGSANPEHRLQLRLALPRGNSVELERRLYDVSTPSSPNYGKYLCKSEVRRLVAPAQSSVGAVNAWVKENGIFAEKTSAMGDWISLEVLVGKANELFATEFSVFRHNDTGAEAVRTLSYSIPAELQGHFDFVHPTVTFPDPVGDLPTIHGWRDLADFLLDQDSPPSVLTTSYGFQEHTISPKLARNLCESYAQLGARGISILFASGDGGVSGTRFSNTCKSFVPTFPSSCPFVTSVGASRSVPETSAELSAGGFSDIFSMPPCQAPFVYRYLSALDRTHGGLYNASGRAYPDVAAQGVGFKIVVGGEERLINGTSASSPVFASVVALINDKLAAKGKPPLGFLNLLLYSRLLERLRSTTS